ncbi:hypothetical protein ACRQ5D_27170 [Mucilaginibacter sp. P25]|uniref:SLAC1 family transporter n=1 Tax=Mucilaginibacter sp. P25 TaxID=3423945 RepID=UPI003D7BE19D
MFLLPVWRHIIQKVPVKYDPQYWSLVFPAGMYAVATFNFSKALDLPFILPISNIFIYFSITAWVIVFAGMLREFIRFLHSEKSL